LRKQLCLPKLNEANIETEYVTGGSLLTSIGTGRTVGLALLLACSAALAQEPSANKYPEVLDAALERQRDAETLASLSAEGQLLYSRERIKLDGYRYCSQAVSLAEQGEFRQSIRAASKALFLGQQDGNDDLVVVSKRDLAIAYSYAGNLERADQYAREALALKARNPALVAGPAYKVLGDVSIRRGQLAEGIGYYQSSLDAASDKFKPLVRISLANAYTQAKQLEQARTLYEQIPLPGSASLRPMYRRGLAQLLLAEGKPREALELFNATLTEAAGSDADYHRLWAQEGIGRSYLALGEQANAAKAYVAAVASTDVVRARFRSEEFKTGLFGDMQQVFEQAIVLAMESGDVATAFEISEKSRARALLDIVRDRVAGSESTRLSATAKSAAAIRAALRPQEALVEYHSLNDRLLAWVVRADGIKGYTISQTRADLDRRVSDFRQAILDRKSSAGELGSGLYGVLIAPLELAPGERLIVVPHGPLHYMPFQALREGNSYLVERNAIAIAPSASVAAQLLGRKEGDAHLVAFGNPELGLGPRYALPGSEREVQELGALFPQRQIFLRREASKARFKEMAANTRIVHVAAHAEVDEVDPLFSRILLAGEGNESGSLEAREVFDLKLNQVSLVTLSACESGLGKIARGDEILGFTRSFLSAGAASLIVSLWPVADDSTELLMTTLYGELAKGVDLQLAMQTAQVTVLKRSRFAHPFFWAPFNLIGDWRATFKS
jgi:CHAT domain-containing protein